jgi:sugar lactone lactonase YvrE
MKRMLNFLTILTLIILNACGNDDSGGAKEVDITVKAVQVLDVENAGDGSDIQVSFNISDNESQVDHYRIFVVKSGDRSAFDLPTAMAIGSVSYFRIEKTGSNISTRLSSSMTDSKAENIVSARNYVVFVMSVGLGETLSTLTPSNSQIALAKTNILNIMNELPIGTGGLVVDDSGNIYSADFGASLSGAPGTLLYKITPSGQASVFARGFIGASGNTIGPDGNIYQSNIGGGKVSKVTMSGTVTDYALGMNGPVGVVFDQGGNLFVANCSDNTIKKVTPSGAVSIFASGSLFACPNGITVDNNDNLYVANFSSANVVKITPSGTSNILVSLPGGNNGHITFFENNLYVVARAANRVYKVTLGGGSSVFVGSGQRGHAEGPALKAELSLPNDLGFSPDGKFLYINDSKPLTGTPSGSLIKPTMLKRVRIDKN